MFSGPLMILAIAALAMFAAGGLAYALMFDRVQKEAQGEKRLQAITSRPTANDRKGAQDQVARRRNIQEALKESDERQQQKLKPKGGAPLSTRIEQAGLRWTKRTFFIFSAVVGAVCFFIGLAAGAGGPVALGIGVVGFLGLPRWYLGYMKTRRLAKFTEELPNAVDVIVRGIKSGLPLGDCLRIISVEAREPVRSEFRQIMESTALGIPIGEACMKLFERVPTQEANFFGIVIGIQQKSGGNLAETLGNLSRVLRDRKKMRAKIVAMSMEAKASASIIGSLPIIVSGLVYLTSPSYIMILFTTKSGNVIVGAALLYMFIGIMVMKKMINFEI